jgi:hypothetical protein
VEAAPVEAIPTRLIPPPRTSVQSSFSGQPAEGTVTPETDFQVYSRLIAGNSPSDSTECG